MITTERLILRRWREEDLASFAALNGDPETMAYFPATLSRAESDAMVVRNDALIAELGYGFWAVERRDDGAHLGVAGLIPKRPDNPHLTGPEVGWRLARHAWGQGYASEAALASLRFGFDRLGLEEIIAITAVENLRSRAVMLRIGMKHDPARDFDHPALPKGHPLERHVFYAISAEDRADRLESACERLRRPSGVPI